jgi:hypothetical protein
VDKFVRLLGRVDLSRLETAPLPEKTLPRDQLRRVIGQAHEHH